MVKIHPPAMLLLFSCLSTHTEPYTTLLLIHLVAATKTLKGQAVDVMTQATLLCLTCGVGQGAVLHNSLKEPASNGKMKADLLVIS